MLRWTLLTLCGVLLVGLTWDQEPPDTRPADGAATSQPTESRTTVRPPTQADILRKLLAREERPTPIMPQDPQKPGVSVDVEGLPLLLEGTFITERPGRLVHEDGRARFVFHPEGGRMSRSLEILQSQLLELMEREADAGFTEFVVSGEVTRYRDRNYLLLRKILRRAGHGNLGP
jgi:hypothetical protein